MNALKKSILSILLISGTPAFAQVVLIDGTSPTYILNGSFETVSGSGTVKDPANWTHIGETAFDLAGVQANNASDGTNSAMIGFEIGDDDYSLAIDTNATSSYTISLGDSYSLSFEHIGLFNWVTNDEMRYTLFYTCDDTLSGVEYDGSTGALSGATVLDSNTFSVTTGAYNGESITTAAVVDGNAVGKHLWLSFTVAAGDDKYGRIDQVNLAVIPEPSTYALGLGLVVLVGLILRRRK